MWRNLFSASILALCPLYGMAQSVVLDGYRTHVLNYDKVGIAELNTIATSKPLPDLSYLPLSGYTLEANRPYQMRLILDNKVDSAATWTLYVAQVNRCILFKKVNGTWVASPGGTLVPLPQREASVSDLSPTLAQFKIRYSAPGTDTLYVAVMPNPSQPEMFLTMVPTGGTQLTRNYSLVFISILVGMLLYHLMLFIQTRWRAYAMYMLYIVCSIFLMMVAQMETNYLASVFSLFAEHPHLIFAFTIMQGPVFLIAHFLFAMELLETRQHYPRWHKTLRISMVVILIILIITVFLLVYNQHFIWINRMMVVSQLAGASLMIAFSVSVALDNFSFARYYVWGVAIQYLIIILVVLANLFYEAHIPTRYINSALFMGIFVELLFFAGGLGYRQRQTELEKIEAQNKLIEQLEKNYELQQQTTLELEEKVAERTRRIREQKEEIVAQNEELTQQGEELLAQRDQLDKQNKLLQESRDIIAKHNLQLEQAVAERTQELLLQSEKLQLQNKQLEQFSFITAHNLRGPVSRILGLINIFDQKQSASNLNKEILDKLVVSARDLDTIIHDLGAVLEAQKRNDLQFETVSLRTLLKEICKRFDDEIKAANAQITIVASVDEIVTVRAYFDSIITNIISNSLKYRNPQVPLTIDISVQTEQNNQVTITITDNGLGLDTELHKAKIFQPFQRFNVHTKGKGLGIVLIKTQVEAMGGQVTVRGQEGKGLLTYITLPIPNLRM